MPVCCRARRFEWLNNLFNLFSHNVSHDGKNRVEFGVLVGNSELVKNILSQKPPNLAHDAPAKCLVGLARQPFDSLTIQWEWLI